MSLGKFLIFSGRGCPESQSGIYIRSRICFNVIFVESESVVVGIGDAQSLGSAWLGVGILSGRVGCKSPGGHTEACFSSPSGGCHPYNAPYTCLS